MRVLIVSNRLPFTVEVKDDKLRFRGSSGGLVSGLSSYLDTENSRQIEHIWIAWPGNTIAEKHRKELSDRALQQYRAYPVYLSETAMDKFYHGFCNKTIWPLFHYFPTFAAYDQEYWNHYQSVNAKFCDAIANIAQPDDLIWVHDYHLMLLPGLLRERLPDARIGFFLHIPFPSFELFRMLPSEWRSEILEGLLGADLLGFHTHSYTEYFLRCVLRVLGYEHNMGQIAVKERIVTTDTFPMGIDYRKYSELAANPEIEAERDKLKNGVGNQTVVLSLDRLDYTKGILNRLQGYELFLERNSEWRNRVVLLLVVVPSRIGVEHYQTMKRQIDEQVGKINGKFGNLRWTPIIYQYRSLSLPQLISAYLASDIALITPLRDGMNLIAKEYLACRRDGSGVLILSEMAGAASELGEALLINPNYREDIATTLAEALKMPREEQIRRNRFMQKRLERYNVTRWAGDFIERLEASNQSQQPSTAAKLSSQARSEILRSYERSEDRVMFLDYDGTLVPFAAKPEDARPSPQLLELLKELSEKPRTDVVLITGRIRSILDSWFHGIPIGFIAEHGMLLKEPGGEWIVAAPLSTDWKPQILPILERYVDRVPGSSIEDKEFSVTWHYRKADPELSSKRARELTDHLLQISANMNLQILPGNKVIEVRNSGVNKGTAALNWLDRKESQWVMAIGDDWTDEDLFRALPATAHTIMVGFSRQSHARWSVSSPVDVIELLRQVANSRGVIQTGR